MRRSSTARTSECFSAPREISLASPTSLSRKTHRSIPMTNTKPIRRVAIIGTGVIGASWAAQYLAKGLEVVATDFAPDAEVALRKFVKSAWPALERLGLSSGASLANLKFTADLAEALSGVDLV